jgi:uncharacterized protein (DUF1800 family)
MAIDGRFEAALALHRFGFGPRTDSIAAIASDPRGALLAELDRPSITRVADAGFLSSSQAARAVYDFRQERQARLRQEQARKKAETEAAAEGIAGTPMNAPAAMNAEPPTSDPPQNVPQQIFVREVQARLDAAYDADIGFAERLVWFWSNHFCISADKIISMAGAYEREAIRLHALGRFADMLQTVVRHPGMLFYLDNAGSIGPTSVAGINRTRGLNENLAREILELHTLGVRGGYVQQDVLRLAYILTGWTIIPIETNPEHGGEFTFIRRMHEPGAHEVLGKLYADGNVEQGRAVLADLARHPATAEHVALKLARHFVADEPPPALVQLLARRFRDTDGDLKEMAKALVSAPGAWTPAREKIKRPAEWVVGMLRAANVRPAARRVLQTLALLGEPMWRPLAPKGFPDDQASWLDGLSQRLDAANTFASRNAELIDAQVVLEVALGPLASQDTRQTVARAESRQQALALLLMAPEFQRR